MLLTPIHKQLANNQVVLNLPVWHPINDVFSYGTMGVTTIVHAKIWLLISPVPKILRVAVTINYCIVDNLVKLSY